MNPSGNIDNKRCFVTGGTGFIGVYLVKQLIEEGYYCRCLVRPGSDGAGLKGLQADVVYGDILEPGSLKGMVKDIDIVFHLAAVGHVSAISKEAHEKFRQVNVEGTRNLAEECYRHSLFKFVHFSSTAAMGLIKEPVVDERTKCQPETPYQKSKWESEEVILGYHRKDGLPVVILRPSMVYGPGGQGEFLKWCRLMKSGLFPRIGRGKNLTPLVHVYDVVQAATLAGQRGIPGEIYLITSEGSFELDLIRNLVIQELRIKRIYPYVPISMAKLGAWALESLAKIFRLTPLVTYKNIDSAAADRVFSISKARNDFGYDPKIDLRDGINQTISCYLEKGYL